MKSDSPEHQGSVPPGTPSPAGAPVNRSRIPGGRRVLYSAIFLVAFATCTSRAHQSGRLSAPPEPGDSHDYDAIAYNLWKLRGYGYFWSDPEYRAPYLGRSGYGGLLSRESDYYPTAYRPPLLPVVLSVVYALTDRNFAAWRILNCAIFAGAVALAAAIAAHFGGLLAAPLAAWVVLQSPLTRYSQRFMTEGLAAFLVTLLAYLFVTNSGRPWTTRAALWCGIVLGTLMASRSIFALWVLLAFTIPAVPNASGSRRVWLGKAVCVLGCLLVISPWWIRNVLVTGAFMPTGTQAGLNLPSGFGPRALKYQGIWRSNPGDGVEELRAENVNPFSIEYEVRLAKIRSGIATTWMREHPADVLRLMVLHVWQEVRPRGRVPWDALLPAGGVALLFFRRTRPAGAIAIMLFAQLMSVALTWGAGGRFMVPTHPLLMALVSAMGVALVNRGLGLARSGGWAGRYA